MKLRIDFIDNDIIINDDEITVIEIENKRYFYRLIKNLYDVYNGIISEQIHFLSGEKEIINPQIAIFNDYFNIDLSSKKINSELYKNIMESIDENMNQELMNIYKKMYNKMNKILGNIDLPLVITKDYSVESIIKLMKITIQKKEDLLDTLLLLIDLERILNLNETLFFINLKQYLYKDEINELYKYSLYNNVRIVLIDNQSYGVCLQYEKKLIIDENLEEFMI